MKKTQMKPYLHAGMTAFLVILASLVAFFLLAHAKQLWNLVNKIRYILRPVSIGLIMAFLMLPIHNWIFRFIQKNIRRKNGRPLLKQGLTKACSILLSLIFVFLGVYILMAMVIPQVYISIVGLVESIPQYIQTAEKWIVRFLDDNPEIQQAFLSAFNPTALSIENWLNNEVIPNLQSPSVTLAWLKEFVLPNVSGVISNVSSLLIQTLLVVKDLFIAIIVSVYLLASKETFSAQCKKVVYSVFRPKYGDLVIQETRNAYRIMSGFINGKLLDSLIIGIITLVCCNLFKFPYPALIAMIIGVTNIIPFFGPFFGAIPSAFLILLVDPIKCLYFCIFVLVLQQFDGNILGPKILGETTGLASFWVLFSILLFGGLFGFAGMVLGVPFFAIIYSIVRRLVNSKLKKRHLPDDTDSYRGVTGKMEPVAAFHMEEAQDVSMSVQEPEQPSDSGSPEPTESVQPPAAEEPSDPKDTH